MAAHPRNRPSELPVNNRTVLARKGALRRAEAARPCALRAVLSGWFRDGRLRRDELRSNFLRPNTRTQITREPFTRICSHRPGRSATPVPLPYRSTPASSSAGQITKSGQEVPEPVSTRRIKSENSIMMATREGGTRGAARVGRPSPGITRPMYWTLRKQPRHALGQGIEVSAFIGVHQRLIILMCRSQPGLPITIGRRRTPMNADFWITPGSDCPITSWNYASCRASLPNQRPITLQQEE